MEKIEKQLKGTDVSFLTIKSGKEYDPERGLFKMKIVFEDLDGNPCAEIKIKHDYCIEIYKTGDSVPVVTISKVSLGFDIIVNGKIAFDDNIISYYQALYYMVFQIRDFFNDSVTKNKE